jgi:hypothetical protein
MVNDQQHFCGHCLARAGSNANEYIWYGLCGYVGETIITACHLTSNKGVVSIEPNMYGSLNNSRSDEYLLRRSAPPSILKRGFRLLWTIRGRRLLFATCACLAITSVSSLLLTVVWISQSKCQMASGQKGLHLEVEMSTNWVLYRYYEDLQPIVSGVGPNIALSSQINAYNFWQTICVTTQSISQHGLRRAGVCDLFDFNDTLWDSLPLFHLANDVMTYVCPKPK